MTEVMDQLWELDLEWIAAGLAGLAAGLLALLARMRRPRLMLLVSLTDIDAVDEVLSLIGRMGCRLVDLDLDADAGDAASGQPRLPAAVLDMRPPAGTADYAELLSAVASLPGVWAVRPLIWK